MKTRFGLAACVLGMSWMAGIGHAASFTWTSATAGNWSDTTKWSGGLVPSTDGTGDVTFDTAGGVGVNTTIDAAWAASGAVNSLTLASGVIYGNVGIAKGAGVTGLTIGAGGITTLSNPVAPLPPGVAARSFNSINVGELTLSASQAWTLAGGEMRFDNTNFVSVPGTVVTLNGSIRLQSGVSTNFQGSFTFNKGGITFGAGNQGGRLGTNTATIGNVGGTSLLIGYNGDGTISTPFNLQNDNNQFSFILNNTPGAKGTTTISSPLSGNLNGTAGGGTADQLNFSAGYVVARSSGSFKMTADNSALTTTITPADFAAGKYPIFVRTGYVLLDNPNAFGTGNSIPFAIGNNYAVHEGNTGGLNFAAVQATSGNDVNSPIRYRTSSGFFNTPGIAFLGLEGAGSVNFNGDIFLNTNNTQNVVGTMHLSAPAGGTAKFNGIIADANADTTGPLQTYKARVAAFGAGTVEVNGNNSYLGSTLVRAGTLVVGHNNALGSATSAVNLGDTTIAPVTVVAATDMRPNATYDTAGNMTFTFGSAVNSVDGVTINNGDRILVHNFNYRAAANGIYVRTSSTVWTRDASFDTGGEFAYGQQVFVNAGTVNGGRTYFLANQTAISPITIGQQALTFTDDIANPNAEILLKSGITLNRNINVVANGSTGTSVLGGNGTTGASTFTGNVTLNKGLTVTAATGGDVTFSGDISGGFNVAKTGTGKVIFSAAKSYSGSTSVTAGILAV
ncbi:MAG: beta strand repeat-containing protein, partial [Phycisphaerales bacterium]